MRYDPIQVDFFIKNREALIKKLKNNSLAIVNSNDEMPRNGDQNFVFRQNSDLFYLTGLDQEKCILLLCPDHPVETMREVVFIPNVNREQIIWYGEKYTPEKAKLVSGVQTVKFLDDFEIVFNEMASRFERIYLNMNEYPKYVTEVPYRDLRFARWVREKYPTHTVERLAPLLTELRLIKSDIEIEIMKKACKITDQGFRRVLRTIRSGMMEYGVEAELSYEFLRNGSSGFAYPAIIASGKNACILHYCVNDKPCKDGDLVLMDFGAEYANYSADCSRTIPINGKFTERQRQVYDAVLRVLRKTIKLLVPGVTLDQVQEEVCKMIDNECIMLGLYTEQDKAAHPDKKFYYGYYMHGVSHFLGLDVHDVGTRQVVLQKGMVVTCEPGIYIESEGIGVRLENDIIVDKNPIDLMADIPIEADEIEELMRKDK
ncbi:MAG: M24 family metallopeptidase [Bacteroidales bacterium]|jgi:Xaa-Pro aminopeptidase|nr:M24 family metallopeptidase [Bacteroidales bacterium]